jgi:hypothetical protein
MITYIDLRISHVMFYQTHVNLWRYQVADGTKSIQKTRPVLHVEGLILGSVVHNWLNSSQDPIFLTNLK